MLLPTTAATTGPECRPMRMRMLCSSSIAAVASIMRSASRAARSAASTAGALVGAPATAMNPSPIVSTLNTPSSAHRPS